MKYIQVDELKDLLSWVKINDRVAYYCCLYILKKPLLNGFGLNFSPEMKPNLEPFSFVMLPRKNSEVVSLGVITNSFSLPGEIVDATSDEINNNKVGLDDSSNNSIGDIIEAIDGLGKDTCSDCINGFSDFSNIEIGASSKDIYQIINDYYHNSNVNYVEKVKHISEMEKAWRSCFNAYPNVFRWLDPKNDAQILWVWEYFKIKMMRIPFEPIDSFQRYNLIVSSFDLWDGWSDEQCACLNKKRKHPLKKSNSNLFDASPSVHKNIFISEIDKARRQQKFRDQRKVKKEIKSVINITGSYINKLKLLSEDLKMDNDKVIKMLIDERVSKMLKDD